MALAEPSAQAGRVERERHQVPHQASGLGNAHLRAVVLQQAATLEARLGLAVIGLEGASVRGLVGGEIEGLAGAQAARDEVGAAGLGVKPEYRLHRAPPRLDALVVGA